MPQRTNDFQEIVALIQRALAPDGAVVTQSALVETGTEGETREIDVLIETKVGEYRIRIAVEAKDEGRPMDSTKFESIIGKYLVEGGVRVNKIVVVTHHGFYHPVIERARKLDIDLLTLEEAKQIDWSHLGPPGPSFKCALEICNVRLVLAIEPTEDVLRDGRVVCSCGRYYGTAQQLAQYLFWELAVRRYPDQLMKIDEEAASQGQEKKAKVDLSEISGDHQRYLVLRGERYPLEGMSFDVHFKNIDRRQQQGFGNIFFSLAPHVCAIALDPPIACADAREVASVGRVVCSCCGKDHGGLSEWVHKGTHEFITSDSQGQRLLTDAVRESPTGHAYLDLRVAFPKSLRVAFKGNDYVVDQLNVRIHAAAGAAPIECKQYQLKYPEGQMKVVSHMEATVVGKRLTILMPDGAKSKRICLRIEDPKTDGK